MLKLVRSYKKPQDISCVIVMVAFNTFDWISPCLEGLREHLPDVDVVVVDNNPCRGTERSKTFVGHTVYGTSARWSMYCELETKWLHENKERLNLQVVQTPHFMQHGTAVDFATTHLQYDAFVHIEPDCDIIGSIWYDRLQERIAEGYWMASGFIYPSREAHPTPSIWRLDVWRYLELSFKPFSRTVFTGQERLFYKVVDVHRMLRTHQNWWDTGIYAAYRCSRRGRAYHVQADGFLHHFKGSAQNKKIRGPKFY